MVVVKRGEGPTKEWDPLWMTRGWECGGSPGKAADVGIDDVAAGVAGPKTSEKSKSWAAPAAAAEEGGGMVRWLSLAARREW